MSKYLDNLPPSTDEMWEHADINKSVLAESPKCEHHFARTKGTEAQCKCGVGYFLDPGSVIKKGHIYLHGQLVI